jgi:hypothetical protein
MSAVSECVTKVRQTSPSLSPSLTHSPHENARAHARRMVEEVGQRTGDRSCRYRCRSTRCREDSEPDKQRGMRRRQGKARQGRRQCALSSTAGFNPIYTPATSTSLCAIPTIEWPNAIGSWARGKPCSSSGNTEEIKQRDRPPQHPPPTPTTTTSDRSTPTSPGHTS